MGILCVFYTHGTSLLRFSHTSGAQRHTRGQGPELSCLHWARRPREELTGCRAGAGKVNVRVRVSHCVSPKQGLVEQRHLFMRVCVCVCDLGVCACARETLGLWGQTYLGSVPPLALPSGFGFLFCESENRGILLPHSIVGRIKWIKRTSLVAQ